jgi:hypothetical protein
VEDVPYIHVCRYDEYPASSSASFARALDLVPLLDLALASYNLVIRRSGTVSSVVRFSVMTEGRAAYSSSEETKHPETPSAVRRAKISAIDGRCVGSWLQLCSMSDSSVRVGWKSHVSGHGGLFPPMTARIVLNVERFSNGSILVRICGFFFAG